VAGFHIDEDLNPQLATQLIAMGYDAVTARQLQMLHAPDGAHLLAAALHGRILVTRNRKDFLLLHDAWNRWMAAWLAWQSGYTPEGAPLPLFRHAGILIIPQVWQPVQAATEIDAFVQQHPAILGELFLWQPQGWVTYP